MKLKTLHCTKTVELPVARLVSWRGDRYRALFNGTEVIPYDRPVARTPHFKAVRLFDRNPELAIESDYVRYFDQVIAAGRTVRNGGEPMVSGRFRLERFRRLYESIRGGASISPLRVTAEHDGRFRINDGLHRAAIALHLGRATVPARIVGVDRRLESLLSRVYADWPQNQRKLYQPIEHVVFQDWPTTRQEDRWDMMKPLLDWEGKKVLDIGAYTGYFSRACCRQGSAVIGVEIDRRRHRVAQELNVLFGSQVTYLLEDFRTVIRQQSFDVALILSVLHWILKSEGFAGVQQCLGELSQSATVLFLDLADQNEPKMRTAKWNHGVQIDCDSIPRIVMDSTNYRHWKFLGDDCRGRGLFMFWREK